MALAFRGRVMVTLVGRGVTVALGLLSSVMTARTLGPEGRGILATLSVLTGLSLQFGNPGLHTGNVYFVSKQPHRTAGVLGNTLVVSFVAGILAAVVAVALAALQPGWFPGIPRLLILVTAVVLPFQFMILLYQNTLLGLQEIAAFNLFEVGNKVLTVGALAAWLLLLGGGAPGAVVLFSGMAVLFGTASALYCARRVPFRPRFDRSLFGEMIRYGARVYVACLLAFLVIRSDMLLVNYFRGTAEAGVYSIAVQIADTLLLLPVTIGMILMPRIAGSSGEKPEEITARVLRHTALLMTLLVGAAAAVVAPVVRLLYGHGFEGAILTTWCLLPGVWALGLNGVLMNHFSARGMPPVTMAAPFVGLILNVALNIAVVPRFGIAGAAVTSSFAYAIMLAFSLAAFLRDGRVGLRRTLLLGREEVRGLFGHARPQGA
jgi:O-antigen/teichoic acid export membrane protein